jgi:hypothetical protein
MQVLLFFFLALFPALGHGGAPEDDFTARSTAAGVVKFWHFDDTTTQIVQGTTLSTDSLGVYRGSLDTTIKASGTGSLRFHVPPPPHGTGNISGGWLPPSPYAMGSSSNFKHNQTFYVQYRARLSHNMLANSWNSNSQWKLALLYRNPVPCANLQIAIVNRQHLDIPNGYTRCGSPGLTTDISTGLYRASTPPYYHQQGDHICQYSFESASTCLRFPTNEWFTIYGVIVLGDWGVANSHIEFYMATERAPAYTKFIDVPDMTMDCNNPPGCSGDVEGYNQIELTVYMTDLLGNEGVPQDAYVWYDELIVSTQPIAAPAGGVPASNHVIAQRTSGGSFVGGGIRR